MNQRRIYCVDLISFPVCGMHDQPVAIKTTL